MYDRPKLQARIMHAIEAHGGMCPRRYIDRRFNEKSTLIAHALAELVRSGLVIVYKAHGAIMAEASYEITPVIKIFRTLPMPVKKVTTATPKGPRTAWARIAEDESQPEGA